MSGFIQHRHESLGDTFLNICQLWLLEMGPETPRAEVTALPAAKAPAAAAGTTATSGQESQHHLRRRHSFAYVAHHHGAVDTSFVERETAARAGCRLVPKSVMCTTNTANGWTASMQDGERPRSEVASVSCHSTLSGPLWHDISFPMTSVPAPSETASSVFDVTSSSVPTESESLQTLSDIFGVRQTSPSTSPRSESSHLSLGLSSAPLAMQHSQGQATRQRKPRRRTRGGSGGVSDVAVAATSKARSRPNGVEAACEMSTIGAMILGRAAALAEDMRRTNCKSW